MASGLIALLDDVALIARSAAASLDDVGTGVAVAGTKAAGVVIDDAAVTPRYVSKLTPDRELPIIAKIALGSLRNKLLILLPISLLLSALLPGAITPLLMIGGAYLAFEATEKLVELFSGGDHHDADALAEVDSPAAVEARRVSGAVRTDLILSAEIMAIALASLAGESIGYQAVVLTIVGVGITAAVYGVVALVVKLDDIGLHLCRRHSGAAAAFGRGLVRFVPRLLTSLAGIGTAAMLWVGGGILVHGLDALGIGTLPDLIHDLSTLVGHAAGPVAPVAEWLAGALAAALVASTVGAVIVAMLHVLHRFRSRGSDGA